MLGFSKPLSKWLCSLAKFAACRMPFSKNSWPSLLLSNISLEALRKQKTTQGNQNRSLLRDLYLETSHVQSVEYVEFYRILFFLLFFPGERRKRAIGAGWGGKKQCHDPAAFLHVESRSDIWTILTVPSMKNFDAGRTAGCSWRKVRRKKVKAPNP